MLNTRNKRIRAKARIAIISLWAGSGILLFFLFTRTFSSLLIISNEISPVGNQFSLDELLLSPENIQLGRNNTLINLGLNRAYETNSPETLINNLSTDRHKVYNNILKLQIEKAKRRHTEDFSIKPVPE